MFFSFINQLRNIFLFRLMYWALRIGMGLTFIASGLRKLPGVKFTTLPVTDPVGAYFEAMYQTGLYWNVIGYAQILIGVLAFFNRSAVMAFILMMPITINIFLISVSLNMRGTPIITACMLLGNLTLMLWHYEQYLPILKKVDSKRVSVRRQRSS